MIYEGEKKGYVFVSDLVDWADGKSRGDYVERNPKMIIEKKLLYDKLKKKFGLKSQLGIAQEELAELIQAISKYNRKGQIDKVIDEMADVYIVLEQLSYYLNIRAKIGIRMGIKLHRIETRLRDDKL